MFVVFWQDHINLVVHEVSSSKVKAKLVKSILDNHTQGECHIAPIEEFIIFLKIIRKRRDENWIDFSPSAQQVRKMKIDKLYNIIIDSVLDKTCEYSCII